MSLKGCLLGAIFGLAGFQVQGQTWNSTSGGNWSDNTATGWNGAGVPSSIGATVSINQDITSTTVIAMDTNGIVGSLTLGDSSGTSIYSITKPGANTLTFDVAAGAATIVSVGGANTIAGAVLNDNLSVTVNGTSLQMSAVAAGGKSLTVSGTGSMTVTAASSFGSFTVNSGATLNYGTTGAAANFNGLTVNGTLNLTPSFSTTYNSASSNLSGSGTINMGSNASLTFGANSTSTFSGTINGAGNLSIGGTSGNGTVLTLSGTNNFTGNVSIGRGTLTLQGGQALDNTVAVNLTGAVNAKLNLSASETVGAVSSSQTTAQINLGANTLTTGGKNTNTTFAGVIDGAGGSLVKTGTGTFTLSGANTYTGTTQVQNGTLLVNGSMGNTAVNVGSGGTLGGSGSIGGAVTFQSGSTNSPGNSPGVATYAGGVTFETGSTFRFELIADTVGGRGTSFDGVNVTGGILTLQSGVNFDIVMNVGSTVDFTSAFWDSNQSWLVFSNTNGPSVPPGLFNLGAISNDANGASFATTGGSFGFTQSGNDILLNYTAVPEPSTFALLGMGLGVLVLLRRKKIS